MIVEKEKTETAKEDNKTQETSKEKFEQVQIIPQSSNKHLLKLICIFVILFLLIFIIIFGAFTLYNFKNSSKITHGIYISDIDVSGLTIDEAKTKLENFYKEKFSNDISLKRDSYITYIKTSEINLEADITSAVKYAFEFGKSDNVFVDNFKILSSMVNGINITPTISYDEEALNKILNNISPEIPDAVVQSSYYIEGKSLIITKGKDGYSIDVNSTSEKIKQKLSDLSYLYETIEIDVVAKSPDEVDIESIYNEIHKDAKDAYYTSSPFVVYPSENGLDFDVSIDKAKEIIQTSDTECTIPLKTLYPNVTTNMIGQEAFPDLLATYSTKYATSNKNRTTNLKLAANKINGYVLLPGDTFSYNTVVGERTISAGYKEAAIYQNGEVVDGVGGGICQISTTLFNAALFANLEMVELYNHQFVPSYATAGRDATVVYGVKDFKFKNSRKYAIKLTCSVSNGTATFQIWGHKEDLEYDVDVNASVTSKTSSYIKSSTYRTLKSNGKVVKKENIMNATYKVH